MDSDWEDFQDIDEEPSALPVTVKEVNTSFFEDNKKEGTEEEHQM